MASNVAASPPTRPTLLLPALTLWTREMVRFYRQPNRVIGAIAQPFVFWVLFGAGLGASFRSSTGSAAAGVNYLEYFFPGSVALIVLFTSIFSSMSLIEDRREGFLQGVLVAPVSRSAIVLGKVLGGTTVAVLQAMLFILLAPLLGMTLHLSAAFALVGALFLTGFTLTSLGFCFAWGLDSTQAYHAIMMVFLMPMWLLSGAFFPVNGVPIWLEWIMKLNPLTYGVALLRHALYFGGPDRSGEITSLSASLAITLAFAASTFAFAFWIAGRRERGAPKKTPSRKKT